MFNIHPVAFFILTLALFTVASVFGLQYRARRHMLLEPEESSFRTLLGASLGLFGVLLGFTFSMANSRFEERRQLEIAEATDLQILWFRTTFLAEPTRIAERSLLRQYLPRRIQVFKAGPDEPESKESLRVSTLLQSEMWQVANDETAIPHSPGMIQFLTALSESIQASEKRTAASENRLPTLSWAILLMLGMMSSVLLGVDLKSRSYILRGMLQIALAASLALTYDIDTPHIGFVQVGNSSMERMQHLMDEAPN
jgi:hypothetical protein